MGDVCVECAVDADCDDSLFCNGAETCDAVLDCQAGTPVACDDAVACTVDACNEAADSCDNLPDDGVCQNGVFCDGAEVCDSVLGCQVGADPCPGAGQSCDEGGAVCTGADPVFWMSFRGSTVVPGIGGLTVDDSDIVQFTPTSLGATTAGTFSLYFDGSDVALTTNGEDVDAITLASDGRLIISTTGGFNGSGASGADEDLWIFTGTLGDATSGSFAQYFDGSDVALNNSSGEDVDAAALTGTGELLFSTLADFAVTGVSGFDEDVVEFSGTFGSATSGSFSLRLDLSSLGIAAVEDIGSLHVVD